MRSIRSTRLEALDRKDTPSDRPAAQLTVGAAVAAEPAGKFAVCVGAAGGIDLGGVFRVLRELDDQPVGRLHINRFAIAVVGFTVLLAGPFQALLEFLVSLRLGLEGDVVVTADLGGLLCLRHS